MARINGTWVALAALTAWGCQLDAGLDAWASSGSDSVAVSQTESALVVPAVEGLDTTMDGSTAAEAAASRATLFYRPADCVRTNVAAATVSYELTNCTGPHGLVRVTGTVFITYERGIDGLHYIATSDGLEVNGSQITMRNSGVYSSDGDTRKLVTEVSSEAVGPRGYAHTRTGTRTTTWTPSTQCLTLEGMWDVHTESRDWSTQVVGYERCAETCPSAGGEIRFQTPTNTLTLRYDGSDRAGWETARGRRGTVALFCGK